MHAIGFSFVTTLFLIYYYRCHIIKSKGRKKYKSWKRSQSLYAKQRERKSQEGKATVSWGRKRARRERSRKVCRGSDNPASSATFAASAVDTPYFFMGSATGTLDPPRSPMVLPRSVQVAQRVWQLQNIKGKKESPSPPSSFLKTAIDVA